MMGGALFLNHPSGANQFQTATVNVEDPNHPASGDRCQTRGCATTSGTTSPPSRAARCTSSRRSTRARTRKRTARPRRTTTRSRGARTTTAAPLLHRARPPRPRLAGAAVPPAHPRRDRVGRRRDAGRLRPDARGPPHRRLVRQGHARRQHREPDGARRRARRQRLLHRAGRPGEELQPGRPQRPHRRHDPGPPRQRERPAGDHARPELRDQQAAVPVLQRAAAPGGEQHLSRFTLDANGNIDMASEERAARVPAPAADLLPLGGLAGLRPGRELYLSTGDDTGTPPQQLRAAGRRRPAQQRPGDPTRRQPRLRFAPHVGQHERPARQDPADHPEGRPDRSARPGNT